VGLVSLVSRAGGTLAEDQNLPGGADLCMEGQEAHRGTIERTCVHVSAGTRGEVKGERRCVEVGR